MWEGQLSIDSLLIEAHTELLCAAEAKDNNVQLSSAIGAESLGSGGRRSCGAERGCRARRPPSAAVSPPRSLAPFNRLHFCRLAAPRNKVLLSAAAAP